MDCNQIQDLMSLALDDMLNKEEMQQFKGHIDGCSECREEYELFQSIHSTLTSEDAASLPDGFHEELMDQPGIYRQVYDLQTRIEMEVEKEVAGVAL